ncbi:glutaredoxin 3 [Leucothrix arctica]|uniref:Glutaredoxin n=1 Tax=Leucothrix arctica TaxID=1481894 RepID=A0A317CJU2_9GAMM|nr:glutaredoxin 3 [Leucothrix arctica]PWQ98756.1 glutaredoxin 3 [Leucothrix arctica]
MPAQVVMYSTRFCPFCMRAKSLLKSKNVEFENIDVGNDKSLWQKMEKLSGQNTVPQIFVNGKALGGFDDINHLDRQGKLDALLNTEK